MVVPGSGGRTGLEVGAGLQTLAGIRQVAEYAAGEIADVAAMSAGESAYPEGQV